MANGETHNLCAARGPLKPRDADKLALADMKEGKKPAMAEEKCGSGCTGRT